MWTPRLGPQLQKLVLTYLNEMGADDGETLHGFRAGCAITLALTGADIAEIMDHVGWTRHHTAHYYLQLAKVLNELKSFVCAFPTEQSSKRALSD